ncbi:MAG: MFS transporter [Acidobacteria bacterium]|nr:MFS transporter [Acidobacteriota bacterium]
MNKRAFIVLVGSMFISMMGMGLVTPFLPIYANTMGASGTEVGLIQAAFSITGIGTLLFVGRLSDRYGRKSFLSGGLTILAIASFGLLYAARPLHLILWRFFQGLGASAHLPIAQAYLGDITPKGSEGKWMGYFNAVLFAGLGAGPLLGGVITDAFSMQASFLVMAALNILGLIATLIFLKEMPRKIAAREHASYLAPLKSRIMRGIFAYRMTAGLGTASLMAFVPLFADLKIGMSASLIGIVLAARTPASIIQSYTGRLADRWNRRRMVFWGGIATVISTILLPLTGGFWTLLIVYILIILGQSFGIPAANAYVVDEGRTYGMGASMTMFMLAMQIGNGIGPVALGGVSDRLGLNYVFYSAAVVMALGIVLCDRILRRCTVQMSGNGK